LAAGPDQARELRRKLAEPSALLPGRVYEFQIAARGLRADGT